MLAVHSWRKENTPTMCTIIVLGASSQQLSNVAQSSTDVSGEVQGKGGSYAGVGASGHLHKVMKQNSITKDTRGTVDSSGVVTNEEVIDVALNPVSSLINRKSRELKVLMEGLLCSYNRYEKGETIQIKVSAHRELLVSLGLGGGYGYQNTLQ